MPFNAAHPYEDLDLTNVAQCTGKIKAMILDFEKIKDHIPERLESLVNILIQIDGSKIKPALQQTIGTYLTSLISNSAVSAVNDPTESDVQSLRVNLQKIANLQVIANFKSLNIQFKQILKPTLFNTIYTAATTQAYILGRSEDIALEPTRIISFHPKDIANGEIIESLKIAFLKHSALGEKCLISCSEDEIVAFGKTCETLVLIGHGRFCREGDQLTTDRRRLSADQASAAIENDQVFIGPSSGNVNKVAEDISNLLIQLPKVTHCRLTICMAGAISQQFIQDNPNVFYKRMKSLPPGRQSASIVFDNLKNPMVFDEKSLAGMIWKRLFIEKNPHFNLEDKDFALTASAEVINPIPALSSGTPHGHFEGTAASDSEENARWQKGKYNPHSAQFWDTKQTPLSQTKSITLATPQSSKHLKRLGASPTESGQYKEPTYYSTKK